MKVGSNRTCDICGELIPPKTNYRVAVMERQALQAFLSCEPDQQPTWQEVGDGSGRVRLDICMDCNQNMASGKNRPNP
jgi:hypothetical protein